MLSTNGPEGTELKLLITGASGFLGGHLCEALAKRHEVIAMVRKGSDVSRLKELGVQLRTADLSEPNGLDAAVAGADAVVHLAAYYTFTGSREMYERINVQGTRGLLEAMSRQGVGRIIYCSSTEAIGPTGPLPADEDAPLRPVYQYGRSKMIAEGVVREFQARGIEHTILRPSGIYGPRNFEDVSYWFITAFGGSSLGRFVVGDGRRLLQFVHVNDVVQAFQLALDGPDRARNRTYNITDSRAYTYDEIYGILSGIFGRRPPRVHIPVAVAKGLVAPVEAWNRLLRKDDFIWRAGTMDTFKVDRNYSIARARDELGYEPRYPLADGLAETVKWYQENGHI